MEPAWSRSIQAPADPLELRSSPEMRRRGADLLFRGYSSPVDKKTIELCCWNRKTRPEQFTAYDLCELRSNDKRAGRQKETSDLSDCSRRLPVSLIRKCCFQSRLLILPEMSTESSRSVIRSELRQHNRAQVFQVQAKNPKPPKKPRHLLSIKLTIK